jgi:hypothetical protein
MTRTASASPLIGTNARRFAHKPSAPCIGTRDLIVMGWKGSPSCFHGPPVWPVQPKLNVRIAPNKVGTCKSDRNRNMRRYNGYGLLKVQTSSSTVAPRAWELKAHSRKPFEPLVYAAVATLGRPHLPQTGRPSRPGGLAASLRRGAGETHLQMVATAAAINLERFGDYLMGKQPVAQCLSPLATLAVT